MANVAFNYFRETLAPSIMAVWQRLDVPSWEVYHPAFQECASDVWKASQSTAQLSYLTVRPLAILCWMVLEVLWQVAQVLFRVLLSQALIHLKRGLVQLKEGAIWFYHFQMKLSRTELLGEVVLVGALIGLYYFYKWIRQQTYWRRFIRWYTATKQKAIHVSSIMNHERLWYHASWSYHSPSWIEIVVGTGKVLMDDTGQGSQRREPARSSCLR